MNPAVMYGLIVPVIVGILILLWLSYLWPLLLGLFLIWLVFLAARPGKDEH